MMKYKQIIENAVNNINLFFIQEFNYDCKSELQERIKEYEIGIKNDKTDYRAAFVNIKEKKITINEYYVDNLEILLFNLVHEILHILSNKDNISDKFVEEGIVQLLTYKIMIGKITQESLKNIYAQDGYRVPVCVMDTVYLLNKNYILTYIKDSDGYNKLLSNVYDVPQLASAMLLKSENCGDLSINESKELLKILQQYNYDFTDLCCNTILIDELAKANIPDYLLENMPLIIQNKNKYYKKREIEKQKIYDLYLSDGYKGLEKFNYDFGSFKKYENSDAWNYIFDVVDEINLSESFNLFTQNINNQILNIVLPIIFKEKKVDIKNELVILLGIKNASMVEFFSKSINNNIKNIKLHTEGITNILDLLLKNELLTEALIQNQNENTEETLLNIIEDTQEKYGLVDYFVLKELFKQYRDKFDSYDNYIESCNQVLNKLGIEEANVMADPKSIWIQEISINENNYLQYMQSLGTERYYSTRDVDYFIQSINYYVITQQEKDGKIISEITSDWFLDYWLNPENQTILDNNSSLIEWEYNGCSLINSGKSQFNKLIKTLDMIRQKMLQQSENFKSKY